MCKERMKFIQTMDKIMYSLDMKKIIQIILIAIGVSIAARIHQIFLPKSYSSVLDFRYSKDVGKTIRSSSIRLIYLATISIMASLCGVGQDEICIGVGTAAFFNVWPAIVQYHLLSIFNKFDKFRLLFGYICFIIFSVIFSYISTEYILKSLQGKDVFGIVGSNGFEILMSLLLSGLAINAETVLSGLAKFEGKLDIKTFRTDLEILLVQTQLEKSEINLYHYEIKREAENNHISYELLETILVLEKIYRGAWYYKCLEILFCKLGILQKIAIKLDFSIGMGQIKISTAQRLLKQNPYAFIGKMLDPDFSIGLCAKYLQEIVESYKENYWNECENMTIYEYIANEYLGTDDSSELEIVRLYAAILENIDNNKMYSFINEGKILCLEKELSEYIQQCEKISMSQKTYYIYGPTNLSVKIKNSEKSLTYLLKKKHKTKIFILELDNEQIWLHIPVVGGKVGSLIENLKEDFAQHEMEGEFSLPSDLTYDEIRESFFKRAIGSQG